MKFLVDAQLPRRLTRLRRENAVLKEEREILKKAARLFAIERATR